MAYAAGIVKNIRRTQLQQQSSERQTRVNGYLQVNSSMALLPCTQLITGMPTPKFLIIQRKMRGADHPERDFEQAQEARHHGGIVSQSVARILCTGVGSR
jgi:hypothetical protein